MYKGKHIAKTPARKAKVGKTAAITVAIVLAVVLAVGGTVAYLTTQSDVITNIFSPSTVMAEVKGGGTDGVYTIKNAGDVDAYLRVAIVANWVDSNFLKNLTGNPPIYWKQPAFAVTYEEGADWFKGSDGFYYYKNPVAAHTDITDKIIVSTTESAPAGYTFSVQVIAEAIQSEPDAAVIEAWGVTVKNGTISK